jgi:hypothetical protein
MSPDQRRAAVVDAFRRGTPRREIAKAVGLSLGRVSQLLVDAGCSRGYGKRNGDRAVNVTVRVSPELKVALEAKAKSAGVCFSEFVRDYLRIAACS